MKKQIRMIIVGLVCVALVVGYYYHLSHRSTKTAEDTTELTAITKITTKNLDTSYPQTPREVIKLYNDILKCYYNEDCTEDEIRALGAQARKLMDDELLQNNPEDQYYSALMTDIQNYKDAGKTINTTDVCDSEKDGERGGVRLCHSFLFCKREGWIYQDIPAVCAAPG